MTATETPGAQAPAAGPALPERPRHTARWVALAVGAVVAVLVVVLATRSPAANVVSPSPLLGQPAPEVEGPGLDGSTVRLSQLRGRWVLVNFFATWCIPCVREHPELVRFSNRHLEDLQVLAVVYDDQPDAVARFFAERGGSWPVVDDPGAKVDFGVRGIPESFLVDPDGVVRARLIGGVTADGLDALLDQARGRS